MSRKPKKSRKKASSRNNNLSMDEQNKLTLELLAKGKFKSALESCKLLLKQENRPEWVTLLASIYEGRTKELAEKGMFKEAVTIWQVRSESCHLPLASLLYFRVLVQAGMMDKALTLYQKNQSDFEQQGVLNEVREQMAALSLTQPSGYLDNLPEDDIIAKDFPIAMSALQAYCDNDDETSEKHLKNIAFRSPFRNLRQILKALVNEAKEDLNGSNAIESTKLLERIAPNSPFKPLSHAIALSRLPSNQLIGNFSLLTLELVTLVASKRGLNAVFVKVYKELNQLGSDPTRKTTALLNLVMRYREQLGKEFARVTALRLIDQTTNSQSSFNKGFDHLSEFEFSRLHAWHLEQHQTYPMAVVDAWNNCEEYFNSADCDSEKEYTLSLAAISRHRIRYLDDLGDCEMFIIDELEKCLSNDIQDKAGYLRLISLHRNHNDLKSARKYLDLAMKVFPDDVAVLSEAVETALDGKAFKKAAQLAAKILKLDPINTRVRGLLISSHLSHTRKLLKQARFALAEKELNIAQSWVKNASENLDVDFVRGILLLDQKQTSQATHVLQATILSLKNEIYGTFLLLLELSKQERAIDRVLKEVGISPKIKQVSKVHLLEFIKLLNANFKKNADDFEVHSALGLLTSSINSAIKHKYSVAEFDLICSVTRCFGLPELTIKYAKKACKSWPQHDVFIYHELAAKMETHHADLSQKEISKLESIAESAHDNGDTAFCRRVEQLLDQLFTSPSFFEPDFDDEDFDPSSPFPGDTSAIDSIIDMMISTVPEIEIRRVGEIMGETDLRKIVLRMIKMNAPEMANIEATPELFNLPEPSRPKKKAKSSKKGNRKKQVELF